MAPSRDKMQKAGLQTGPNIFTLPYGASLVNRFCVSVMDFCIFHRHCLFTLYKFPSCTFSFLVLIYSQKG